VVFAVTTIALGVTSWVGSAPLALLTKLVTFHIYFLTFLAIPLAIGFSILRYRLWDVDLILRGDAPRLGHGNRRDPLESAAGDHGRRDEGLAHPLRDRWPSLSRRGRPPTDWRRRTGRWGRAGPACRTADGVRRLCTSGTVEQKVDRRLLNRHMLHSLRVLLEV
jgi:hypothetical protein